MKAHCLFEQSGTFKNEFKKLGVEAYDYDILNDFGETDFQIDLFAEIAKSYEGGHLYLMTSNKKTSSWHSFHARCFKRTMRSYLLEMRSSKSR